MNIIVTGGTGFLGRRLIPALRAQGHHVSALARSREAADALRKCGAEPLEGDLNRPRRIRLPSADAVVHAAAHFRLAGPRRPFFKTNVEGTRALIAAARKAGIPNFVAIGAAAVVMDDTGSPVLAADETAATYPKSFSAYIASKAQAEALTLAANGPGFRTVVLRPPGIWGPGDAFSSALPNLVRRGQFAFIDRGDYPYVTCHVDNVVEATLAALNARAGGKAYFINDTDIVTFRAFAAGIAGALDLDVSRTRSISYGLARRVGGIMETLWALGGAKNDPPLSRTMVRLIGRPFTTRDAAARKELGYMGKRTRADGLAAYRQST